MGEVIPSLIKSIAKRKTGNSPMPNEKLDDWMANNKKTSLLWKALAKEQKKNDNKN